MQYETKVTFLGTASVVPEVNNDTASLLINRKFLVDTGWYTPLFMRQFGFSPLNVEAVFLSHCHHDHYLGLVQLLFYWFMHRKSSCGRIRKIYGPEGDLELLIESTYNFLRREIYSREWAELNVEICPLSNGAVIHNKGMEIKAYSTNHTIPSLCYVFEDLKSGVRIAVTGDTAYCKSLEPLVYGVDLLVHEVALGANKNSLVPDHSYAEDASRLACRANVKKLALTHCMKEERAAALRVAKESFKGSYMPKPGETFKLKGCTGAGYVSLAPELEVSL